MLKRVFTVALLSGFIAGLAVTCIQTILVIPLILKAESYERQEASASNSNGKISHLKVGHQLTQQKAEEAVWSPDEGLERLFYTAVSNIVTGVAFALLLVGIYILRNKPVDFNSGLLWGAAGFVIFSAAPAMGLPPELPGMKSSVLGNRQLWWIGTVVATSLGLGIFIEKRKIYPRLVAMFLIAMPHIIGAPNVMLVDNSIPSELSAKFVVVSLVTAALFWVTLGSVSGFFYQRFFQMDSPLRVNFSGINKKSS